MPCSISTKGRPTKLLEGLRQPTVPMRLMFRLISFTFRFVRAQASNDRQIPWPSSSTIERAPHQKILLLVVSRRRSAANNADHSHASKGEPGICECSCSCYSNDFQVMLVATPLRNCVRQQPPRMPILAQQKPFTTKRDQPHETILSLSRLHGIVSIRSPTPKRRQCGV